MMWFFALVKCIFCCQDDDFNELADGHRYHQIGQGSVVERSSFHPRSSGQSDSETRPFFRDVKIAHSSVPQSSQGPSFIYGGSHVHPRTPIASHVPPLVPIARPHQACPDLPPQRALIEKALLKTPSVSTPLPSSSSHSLPEHPLLSTFESSSSSSKRPLSCTSKPLTSFPENALPVSKPALQPSASLSHKSALPLVKQTLAPSPSILRDWSGKTKYTYVEKGTSRNAKIPKNIETDDGPKVVKKQAESLIFVIPKDIVKLIEKDIVPGVLRRPLSPSTYTDYFAALLYAEDFYCERGTDYLLENVTLELHEASIYRRGGKNLLENERDDKTFVAFDMDSVQERRPFLLSRDFVHLKPSASDKTIQGVIYRVVKSKTVLVEFNEDFYAEHYPSRTYDVSFSFNRVCLKRAHQAIKAASDPSLRSFLFPDVVHRSSLSSPTCFFFTNKLDPEDKYVVSHIVGLKGSPPFLLEGVKSVSYTVIQEAIVHLIRTFPNSRILVCAPTNNTCDVLMTNLKKEIPESDMFRANAAFRERHEVPDEVLPSCRYDAECFICPSLEKLKKFKVVSCTYVSSFRLNGEGITAGHFSHIFLVDGSSATEPELMIALATFANDDTSVVVTGEPHNRPGWVRSEIARENGLRMSYFERLRKRSHYKDLDPI